MSVDTGELDDPHHRPDFRRANGAPQIVDRDGKNQRYSRPSGWGKELDDENALVNWKLNRAIEGVAKDSALQARAVAAKTDDRATWKDLREAAINAGRGDQAADIGTAIHAMSERWEDPDDDFDPGEPYRSHLEAYSVEMERLGLISGWSECHIVNDEYRAAGTADRLYVLDRELVAPDGSILPVGTVVVGDLKTGKSLDFSKAAYSIQMALYAGGQLYNVVKDEYVATPEINPAWGILMHLPSDRVECEALWVDLEAGRWGAYLVQQVRKWRRDWNAGRNTITRVEAVPQALAEIGEVMDDPEEDHREWLTTMSEWAQERLNAVRHHDQAAHYLKALWPEGVATPKQGIDSISDMKILLDHLDETEKKFGLPFVPRPGVEAGHKSSLNTTNLPKEATS